MARHRIHWDHYFVQWCLHWLPTLGLRVEGKPQFSQLPLEADILVITAGPEGTWQTHPIWKYLSPYTIVEFKSVQDPFEAADFGKLMAYVGLTMEREKLPPEVEIAGWLIVPYINRQLRHVLQLKQISLQPVSPGVHQAHTGLFPLLVVEYNLLPNEPVFAEFKTFMKRGSELRKSMEMALRKWEGSILYKEYTTIITGIHKQEAKEMIEILEQDKKNFKEMAELMLEKLGHEAEDLPFIQKERRQAHRAIARQMKNKKFDLDTIAELTGLPIEEIAKL